MCGRYSLGVSAEVLAAVFKLIKAADILPRYNIAPSQRAPVIRLEEDGSGRGMDLLRWGLVPSWADDSAIGNRLINARSESAATTPAFRSAFRVRRCLVPSDGYYDWKAMSHGKQPFYVRRRDGQPFAYAGLWERWDRSGNEPIESFTILTTAPNDLLRSLHDRMPAIIQPEDYDAWLDPKGDDLERLKGMLSSTPAEWFELRPVSARVNNPRVDDASLVDAIELPPQVNTSPKTPRKAPTKKPSKDEQSLFGA